MIHSDDLLGEQLRGKEDSIISVFFSCQWYSLLILLIILESHIKKMISNLQLTSDTGYEDPHMHFVGYAAVAVSLVIVCSSHHRFT